MKKIFAILSALSLHVCAARPINPVIQNPYEPYFEKAYQQYPSIPRGALEAVAYMNTRFYHITHNADEPESCSGIPKAYGVMGLVPDGKGFFGENLKDISKKSGIPAEDIILSPEKNILAYAAAFNYYLQKYSRESPGIALCNALLTLSELRDDGSTGQVFARDAQLYGFLTFMNDAQMAGRYHFPQHSFDMKAIFGEENLKVLSSARVSLSREKVSDFEGNNYKAGNSSIQSADYGPALWVASPNYNSRNGTAITAVTIHDTEGSYAASISWFQNTSSQVSAHYVIRSSDGQITQMVLEANRAWHVGTENDYTIGIEHEGYASQTGWYTTAMYQQSALLVADICNDHAINPKRTLFQPWGSTTYYSSSGIPGACTKIKGHMHYPNQTHTDPGPNWDWDYYYKLVNNPGPAATVYSTSSGNFYDSGGSGGNYSDDERSVWTISPAGATNVTLTFSNFDVENTWDYMYVYDGPDIWSPLIGYYTGTTNPGTLIASTGTMTIEFRSDCATNATGWNASWTSNASTISPANLAITTASCPQDSVTLKWSNSGAGWFVDVSDDPTFTNFYNKAVPNLTSVGCPGGFANNNNTNLYLAFEPNTTYYWRVWDGNTETYGNSFMTPTCNYQDTSCSGTFDDTGGPGAPYSGNEDYVSIFQPANASSITMTFTSFDLETNFDSLWIFDGPSTAAPLIGVYTGTVSPGNIVANSGAMSIRFKADPFVNHAGWTATWNCTQNSTGIQGAWLNNLFFSVYPNPVNGRSTISYNLPQETALSLLITDVLGNEVVLLPPHKEAAGNHALVFDTAGAGLSKGVYFMTLKTSGGSKTVKTIIE